MGLLAVVVDGGCVLLLATEVSPSGFVVIAVAVVVTGPLVIIAGAVEVP